MRQNFPAALTSCRKGGSEGRQPTLGCRWRRSRRTPLARRFPPRPLPGIFATPSRSSGPRAHWNRPDHAAQGDTASRRGGHRRRLWWAAGPLGTCLSLTGCACRTGAAGWCFRRTVFAWRCAVGIATLGEVCTAAWMPETAGAATTNVRGREVLSEDSPQGSKWAVMTWADGLSDGRGQRGRPVRDHDGADRDLAVEEGDRADRRRGAHVRRERDRLAGGRRRRGKPSAWSWWRSIGRSGSGRPSRWGRACRRRRSGR